MFTEWGWTKNIAVVREVVLDYWHSHRALRSIGRVFKLDVTSNQVWVRFAPWPDLFISVSNWYCSWRYSCEWNHATQSSIRSVYFRFSSITKRQLVDWAHALELLAYRSDWHSSKFFTAKSSQVKFISYLKAPFLWKGLGYVHTVPDSETERRRKCTG